LPPLWYVYPMWHRVSFTLIAEQHVRRLRKWFRLTEIDELVFPSLTPYSRPLVILHPFFFIMMRLSRNLWHILPRVSGFIGIDVADSDRISNVAVSMTDYALAMIVPSEFARRSYVVSGVKVPVYVVPHGVDKRWFTEPPRRPTTFFELARLKERGYKLLLYFLWHSPFRKGFDLVVEAYKALKRERKDVVLVVKTMGGNGYEAQLARRLGGVVVGGWLTDAQKMELYDLSDVYLLFSRGGGFELNGLEAVARGIPVVAAKGGAWEDYLPPWSLVESRRCDVVLHNNAIHVGGGVEIIVEKAVDRIHDILENLDEYKARMREHAKKISNVYNWDAVAEKLRNVINEVMARIQ